MYIYGLYLDGCAWSGRENKLVDSEPKKLYHPLPVLYVTGVQAKVSLQLASSGARNVCLCWLVRTRHGLHGSSCHDPGYVCHPGHGELNLVCAAKQHWHVAWCTTRSQYSQAVLGHQHEHINTQTGDTKQGLHCSRPACAYCPLHSHLALQDKKRGGIYEAPCYRVKARMGLNFITTFSLRTEDDKSKWILRGVALLCSID